MRYVARRHIDFFRPGDDIPRGHYPADTLERLVSKGMIEGVVDVPPVIDAPEPQAVESAPKEPAKAVKRGGKLRNR